ESAPRRSRIPCPRRISSFEFAQPHQFHADQARADQEQLDLAVHLIGAEEGWQGHWPAGVADAALELAGEGKNERLAERLWRSQAPTLAARRLGQNYPGGERAPQSQHTERRSCV